MPIEADQIKLLGESTAFMALVDQVSRVAPLNRPVLVVGERGSGKELIAARLHFLSTRWNKNYEKLNCAALPENLLESELFGYEPGAFTGATRAHIGRFERAHEGSLFLDEIATMSHAAQEKLLRVIEYGEFERLGGSKPIRVNVRVIAAANVDLPSLVESGGFRADLLDRLAFDVLTVPPLRARRSDIPLLAHNFAHGMAVELGWVAPPVFSDRVMEVLLEHAWPGNVRELKNTIERAVYRWNEDDGPIDAITLDPFESPWRPAGPALETSVDAPPFPRPLPEAQDGAFKDRVEAFERSVLEQALEGNRYNKSRTAEQLGMTYDQLRHALRKHQLG